MHLIDYISNGVLYKESKMKRQIVTFTGNFRDENYGYTFFLRVFGELIRNARRSVFLTSSGVGLPFDATIFGDGKRRKREALA